MPALNRTLIRRTRRIITPAKEEVWYGWGEPGVAGTLDFGEIRGDRTLDFRPDNPLAPDLSSIGQFAVAVPVAAAGAILTTQGVRFLLSLDPDTGVEDKITPFTGGAPRGYVASADGRVHLRIYYGRRTTQPVRYQVQSPLWNNTYASSRGIVRLFANAGNFLDASGRPGVVIAASRVDRIGAIDVLWSPATPEVVEETDHIIPCELRETVSVLMSVQEPDPTAEAGDEDAMVEVEVIDTRERWLVRTGTVTHFQQLLDPEQAERVKTVVGIEQGQQFDIVESRYLVRATTPTPIHPPVTPTPPVTPAEPTDPELGTYAIVSSAAIPYGTVYAAAGIATLNAAAALPSGFARTVSTAGAVLTGPAVTPDGVTGIRFQVHVGQREAANLVVPYAPMFGRGFVFLGNDAQGNGQWLSYRVSAWSAGGGLAFFPYGENTTVPPGTSLRVSLVHG